MRKLRLDLVKASRECALQHGIRDSEQDFFLTDWHGLHVFHLEGLHINDQVDIAVEQVGRKLRGVALHQL